MTNKDIIVQIQAELQKLANLFGQLQLDSVAVPIPSPQPTPKPSPTPSTGGVVSGTNPPTKFPVTSPISCVQFTIICEKPGAKKDGVVLSSNDFNILKSNDHVFTVLPVNPTPFLGIPNISIHDLNLFINSNSITKVPDVPANDV